MKIAQMMGAQYPHLSYRATAQFPIGFGAAGLIIGKMIDFPDRAWFHDYWRLQLEEALRRYSADPTDENRVEFRRLLRLFADLVVRGVPPPLEAYPRLCNQRKYSEAT
jgi:hypothetical protein